MKSPQRASKIADIYMQEKVYNMHKNRLREIRCKPQLKEYLDSEA